MAAPTMAYIEAPNVNGTPVTGTLQQYRKDRPKPMPSAIRHPIKRVRITFADDPERYLRAEMS